MELAAEDADRAQQAVVSDAVQDDATVVKVAPDFPHVLLR